MRILTFRMDETGVSKVGSNVGELQGNRRKERLNFFL
jgi:hypothetical protein